MADFSYIACVWYVQSIASQLGTAPYILHKRPCDALIHRDISGRNLLLVKREKFNLLPLIKVADFGLTRMGPVYKMTIQHEVPFLVSAVECLVDDAQWTFKSDCWSFGVLMWELFNNCMAEPYAAEGVHLDTGMLLDALKQGLRLRVSADMQMPTEAETLMKDCFEIQ
uniref:Protein kinase domain-containing protein n=1 Tax=Romanomermis culicivorax TaxID=13658 RepID=A0A915HQA2_ROMCU